MAKLTETFNDRAKSNSRSRPRPSDIFIEPSHEPTVSDPLFVPPNILIPPTIEIPQPPQPEPAPQQKELRVALIGTAPSSRLLAPYQDPAWTIWACSPGNMNTIPKADVWFELPGIVSWPVAETLAPNERRSQGSKARREASSQSEKVEGLS